MTPPARFCAGCAKARWVCEAHRNRPWNGPDPCPACNRGGGGPPEMCPFRFCDYPFWWWRQFARLYLDDARQLALSHCPPMRHDNSRFVELPDVGRLSPLFFSICCSEDAHRQFSLDLRVSFRGEAWCAPMERRDLYTRLPWRRFVRV